MDEIVGLLDAAEKKQRSQKLKALPSPYLGGGSVIRTFPSSVTSL